MPVVTSDPSVHSSAPPPESVPGDDSAAGVVREPRAFPGSLLLVALLIVVATIIVLTLVLLTSEPEQRAPLPADPLRSAESPAGG